MYSDYKSSMNRLAEGLTSFKLQVPRVITIKKWWFEAGLYYFYLSNSNEEENYQIKYWWVYSGEFPLGGAKVNSTHIGTFLETYFVVGDSHNNVRLYTF